MFAEKVVVAIVSVEFLIIEIKAGEQLVFFEDKVGDDGPLRGVSEVEGLQLFETTNQKCKLGLEGGARLPLVEGLQEGVGFGFHDPLGIQALAQNARQSALADS